MKELDQKENLNDLMQENTILRSLAWLDTLPDELNLCVGGQRARERMEAYQITVKIMSCILQA